MLALLFTHAAHAACALEQKKLDGAVEIVVQALAEPVACRTIAVTSDAPLSVEATVWSPEGRRSRLKRDHLRRLPGGGWEIGAPELLPGGFVHVALDVVGEKLDVRLAPAPEHTVVATRADEVRTITLTGREPGWGFADPKLARTDVVVTYVFPPDAPTQFLPLPEGARDVDSGGLARVPDGVVVPAGTATARVAWSVDGAEAQDARTLLPGTLTLLGPQLGFVTSGVPVTMLPSGVRFEAPEGGEARWRVASAGENAVIPDVATFVAGLDWRFARASLPEPAVPMELRGKQDRAALFADLLAAVARLHTGALPGKDPLDPRQLNKAWQSGWVTPVERALVLQRLLGQERFRAAWVLTGENADPATLTGFDRVLLNVAVEGDSIWLDPACAVCAVGEVGTRWLGKPAIGLDLGPVADVARETAKAAAAPWAILPAGASVPRQPGRLARSLALVGDRFRAKYVANGAAALWLRERLADVEPAARGLRLAEALGMPDGTVVEASGLREAGGVVVVVLEGPRPPEDPFPAPDATPWAGGWGDALE